MKSQWSIKLPSGEYLDTPVDFSIQFEFNNQVFSTGDATVLPGAFSFPVTVTLTPRMRQQLNHPDRIDNPAYFQNIEGVVICIDGNPLFTGTLKVEKVSGGKVSISVIVNPLSTFKKTTLDTLDLGGDRTLAPAASWPDLMMDTANNPEDYDFVFFPVVGFEINSRSTGPSHPVPWFFQNYFNEDTGEFTDDSGIISPFVKVEYLLNRIFSNLGEGYQFSNAWQGVTELKRLYVYNNVDLRQFGTLDSEPALPDTFTLNRFVPKVAATEFLKKLTAQWCLGMFTNHFKRTFRIVPLSTVLGAATKLNWTRYAMADSTIESPEAFPPNFNYNNPNISYLRAGIPQPHNAEHYETFQDYITIPPTNEFVHIESHTMMIDRDVNVLSIGINLNVWKLHAGYYTDDDGAVFDPGMESLFSNDVLGLACYESSVNLSRWTEEALNTGGSAWAREDYDFPTAVMFYRGIQELEVGTDPFPLSGNHVWKERVGAGDRIEITGGSGQAEWSMNWEGEYGLYNKAWKQWHTMLTQGKHVTQTFIIPVQVLREFSFEDKVRVGNMDFFLKRLRIQRLLADGMIQVESSMVSVI